MSYMPIWHKEFLQREAWHETWPTFDEKTTAQNCQNLDVHIF